MWSFLPHITIIVKKKQLVKKRTKNEREKKKTKEKTQQHRLMLELADLMPDCWLEVSLHPEGPATGQLDEGFPWFSLVPEQMLVPKFHIAMYASHASLPIVTLKMSPYTNVTLTLVWITLFMGDMGEEALHRGKRK
jgi:hypothetical protein